MEYEYESSDDDMAEPNAEDVIPTIKSRSTNVSRRTTLDEDGLNANENDASEQGYIKRLMRTLHAFFE
jgi:hypothetical protein